MSLPNIYKSDALLTPAESVYKLIEDQTKSLMLVEAQEEFVFKVIDPAIVPELKCSPKRALICVLGTLLGGMLGVAIVLVRFAFRKEDIEDPEPRLFTFFGIFCETLPEQNSTVFRVKCTVSKHRKCLMNYLID